MFSLLVLTCDFFHLFGLGLVPDGFLDDDGSSFLPRDVISGREPSDVLAAPDERELVALGVEVAAPGEWRELLVGGVVASPSPGAVDGPRDELRKRGLGLEGRRGEDLAHVEDGAGLHLGLVPQID